MNKLFFKIGIFTSIVILFACDGGDSSPGYEYMPNMYRSPSIETYGEHNIPNYNGLPVEGTISQGHLSTFNYGKSDEEYKLAGGYKLDSGDVLTNYMGEKIGFDGIPIDSLGEPIILTLDTFIKGTAYYPPDFNKDQKTLNQGKKLFGMMCAHCHGKNGDGKGTIQHSVYSAVPSYSDTKPRVRSGGLSMNQLTEGHIFHAITYGLRAMGPHKSQISEEERWKIVYYIQEKLQK